MSEQTKKWFSHDGKELRGSIEKGDKRGDAVVQTVSHEQRETYAETFYNGKKESEIPCVRELLKNGLSGQKSSLDALHLNPETTKLIHENNGVYLIGIKENQSELLEELSPLTKLVKPDNIQIDPAEKGHGRIDNRTYKSIGIGEVSFDKRWDYSGFETLIWVERRSFDCRSNRESKEVSYYISNMGRDDEKGNELFNAVRNHWKIETNNYLRDVTLKEDKLRTKHKNVSKIMASCRTIVLNFLGKEKLENIRAQMELFVDDFQTLIQWMRKYKFL